MSTIPTTSRPAAASYTVVGGTKGGRAGRVRGVSIILLHRGGIVNRPEIFDEFEKLGADEILSVEGPGASYDIEPLAMKFPRVRFIILHAPANPGERINIGMQEAAGGLAAVLWSDMTVQAGLFSDRAVDRLREDGALCAAPWVSSRQGELLPVLQVPAFNRKRLKVLPIPPSRDEAPSLFPYDYCGVYGKEKFVLLGGYDHRIGNPYWQKLDFGFRAHLWGEKIVCVRAFRVTAGDAAPADNATPDAGYRTFFLKNLAVRFTGDRGVLPGSRFASFFLRCGCGVFTAAREFRQAREWVEKNAYRFRMDSGSVTELWEDPE